MGCQLNLQHRTKQTEKVRKRTEKLSCAEDMVRLIVRGVVAKSEEDCGEDL